MKYKIEVLNNGAWVELGEVFNTRGQANKAAQKMLSDVRILNAIFENDGRPEVKVVKFLTEEIKNER